MTWAMVLVTRLTGNEESKREGSKGNGDDNEGSRQRRGQGQQGNGNGNKGGGQADGNDDSDEEGDGGNDKIRGQQLPTFAHHRTMTHNHSHNSGNNDKWHCWTQQSTASML
jgi:hypothetical protein